MNASAVGFKNVRVIPAVFVLVEGDSEIGLQLRGNVEIAKLRSMNNKILAMKYFNTPTFRSCMDIIFQNYFGDVDQQAVRLNKELDSIIGKTA